MGSVLVTDDEIKKHNAQWMPFCGKCYYSDEQRGRWGHCQTCESKRLEYEERNRV